MSLAKKVRMRKGRSEWRTIRVKLTSDDNAELRRLCDVTGFSTSYLVRYALSRTRYLIEHYESGGSVRLVSRDGSYTELEK